MRRLSTVAFLAGLMLVVVATATPVHAQRQLGAIQGTITDQTGGVIPGVTVTVTNKNTGEVRTTVTNEVGIYRLPEPRPRDLRRRGGVQRLRPRRPQRRRRLRRRVGRPEHDAVAGGRVTRRCRSRRLTRHPDGESRSLLGGRASAHRRSADCGTQPADPCDAPAGHPRTAGGTDFLAQEQGMGSMPAASAAARTTRWSTG